MSIRLSRQIIAATLFKLLLNIGRRFVYPFAPALSRGLDVPLTAITSIIATSQITSLVGLFSGPLADRIGYRFMMQMGLLLLAIGMLICGILPSYWVVFGGLVLASFGKILFDPALQAYIGKEVHYTRRARAIGITELSWAGSTLIGIPFLGLVIEYAGLPSSFYLLAVLGFLAWFLAGQVFPPDERQPEARPAIKQVLLSISKLIKIRPAAGMLAFGFWISLANDNLFVVYGAWFEKDFQVSLVSLGFSTIAIGTAELLGEFATTSFADKIGLKRAIIIGLVMATIAYLLLPIVGVSLALAMVGIFLVFSTFEFTIVTSFSLSTELMPRARATMMAGFFAAAGLGRMVGVLIGGLLWRHGGIHTVAWFSAAFTCLGLVSLLWGLKGWRPDTDN
ncbi:MAG: MFS transporter [Desulfocapsaceae bacterium]|nr:MFS transporter [Desulfocapsaceae bacterium]